MAEPGENRNASETEPTTRAPDRSPYMGIGATVLAVVAAVVLLAVLFGAFDGEDESVVEETENTMMGGGATGAEVEDVIEDEGLLEEGAATE